MELCFQFFSKNIAATDFVNAVRLNVSLTNDVLRLMIL